MKLIQEYLAEKLVNTVIFEMAKSLDDYENLVENMIDPIMAHIILILKARQENSTDFVDHWKKELRGFFKKFLGIKLKVKNTYNKRYNHAKHVICDELELDTDDWVISQMINFKMEEEGYDLSDKNIYNEFLPIIHDFQNNHINIIIDLIADQNPNKIKEYINNL